MLQEALGEEACQESVGAVVGVEKTMGISQHFPKVEVVL